LAFAEEVNKMQLFIKTSIFTVGFLLCSTVIFAEKADKKYTFPLPTLEDYDQAIHLDPDNAQAYYKRGVTHMIYCYKMRLD
jgi:hypothetical protein